MRQPDSQWGQYQGKAMAELLRGSGRWPFQKLPCRLEPPHHEYDRKTVTAWDCVVNGWEGPWTAPGIFGTRPAPPLVHPLDAPLVLPAYPSDDADEMQGEVGDFVPIVVEQFTDDDTTIPKATQFILSLPALRRPIAFEIIGLGPQPIYKDISEPTEILEARRQALAPASWTEPTITVQFVAHRRDAEKVESQLLASYPNSSVVANEDGLNLTTDLLPPHDLLYEHGYGSTLSLAEPYCYTLKTFTHLDPDPLGVAIAAMENLPRYHWAMVQVLFLPTEHRWSDSLRRAVTDPYKTDELIFSDIPEKALRDKFSTPLFAVSVRIAALAQPVYQQLLGWANQFSNGDQEILSLADKDENYGDLAFSMMAKCTFQPGILLNAHELASLVHVPSQKVVSERLRRVQTRTRQAVPTANESGSVVLGKNVHRGKTMIARIPADLRARHCYIAGASGTGKSTLLLNMILQDIGDSHGVGVLDPHGDLIKAILPRIPQHRVNDVILFDATDEAYPFALNILSAANDQERERIVNETIMSLERYFPASWGPRLERILMFAIHTVLSVDRNATLDDVERMLIDHAFRASIVERTTIPRYRQFWAEEFRTFPKNAVDPVLNKLSVFLMSQTVRNIVCQRRCTIDFDQVLNTRKILLVNLSTGLLTERIANILGSFLVTKIVNAAFRRARLPQKKRKPWYLYVDEFQNFMSVSVGFERILAEARKYNLCLAGLANQYVGQLSVPVRQAIFGNIGVMIVFRLGVDDAHLVAKEMGVFEAPEIMNLDVGQAIARAGGSNTAYNLTTYPEPPRPKQDFTNAIRDRTRRLYSSARAEVQKQLESASGDAGTTSPSDHDSKRRKPKQPKPTPPLPDEPRDPNEDDFVQ